MQEHLVLKCSNVNATVRKRILDNSNKNIRSSAAAICSSETPMSSTNSINSSTIKLNKKQIDDSRMNMAMMIFTSGSPFAIVENHWFKKLFNDLGLSKIVPDRHSIGVELLDLAYNLTMSKNDNLLSGKCFMTGIPISQHSRITTDHIDHRLNNQ